MGQPPKTTQKLQPNETLQTRSCKSCESAITNWIKLRLTFQPPLIPFPVPEAASNSSDQWGGYGKPWAFRATSHGSWMFSFQGNELTLPKKKLHGWDAVVFLNLVPDLSWSILSNLQAFCTAFSIRICKRTASNTVGGTSGEMERLSKNCGD